MNTITDPSPLLTHAHHLLLGSFEIVARHDYQRGRPYQQTRLVECEESPSDDKFFDKLKSYKNWNGHWYAESHIEEWVARTPALLFPNRRIHVLASQNYAHLGEKIDLLLLDDRTQFHIVEVKAERVASNRGVPPDQIAAQMNRYLRFLQLNLPPFPESFANYYEQFSAQFRGSPRQITADLQDAFGGAVRSFDQPLVLNRTFLTEGYDEYAIEFFTNAHLSGQGSIRLVYYRFYSSLTTKEHYIDFWEIPMPTGEEAYAKLS